MTSALTGLSDIHGFDALIDVRSPAEFADDHLPGAINCPVLDNEQRARVGTLYKQTSPFEAKKIGAALIAANIGRHLQERFLDRPKGWKPLVYCWRGGDRSGALVTVFRSIGWRAGQLAGGYKTYRRWVIEQLASLPQDYHFQVVCGPTGSAKTRILQALARQGAQVLDLETLACHKGSVLGVLPDTPQPSQKWFETSVLQALAALDRDRPIYIEAESRKIGNLQVPEAIVAQMRRAPCVEIAANPAARVSFLLRDYGYFPDNPAWLKSRLAVLHGLQSNETLAHWNALIDARAWPELVGALLERHYDPLYQRSQARSFAGYGNPRTIATDDLSATGIEALARTILQG